MAHIIDYNAVSDARTWLPPEFSDKNAPVFSAQSATLTSVSVEQSTEQKDDAHQEQLDKAYQEAKAAAEEKFEQEWKERLQAADATLSKLHSPMKRIESELNEVLLRSLSLAIEKICFLEAEKNPTYLQSLVQQLIELAADEKSYRIHMSETEYQSFQALLGKEKTNETLSEKTSQEISDGNDDRIEVKDQSSLSQYDFLVLDHTLKAGQIKLHAEDLHIDASLDTRIHTLLNELVSKHHG